MMQISGLENLTPEQLDREIQRGGRFVRFEYCISLLVVTHKRTSDVFFLRPEDKGIVKGLAYTVISALLGWWGFPWGPIYTVAAISTNFRGGRDVTWEALNAINGRPTTLI
jgi:hypothetical protein